MRFIMYNLYVNVSFDKSNPGKVYYMWQSILHAAKYIACGKVYCMWQSLLLVASGTDNMIKQRNIE